MTTQISEQQARAYGYLATTEQEWITAHDLEAGAAISGRAARGYLRLFTTLGLLERHELSPGFRYRLVPKWRQTEASRTLERACQAFGIL